MFFRKTPEPMRSLTLTDREQQVIAAFTGAPRKERMILARNALALLDPADRATLIREGDREMWSQLCP